MSIFESFSRNRAPSSSPELGPEKELALVEDAKTTYGDIVLASPLPEQTKVKFLHALEELPHDAQSIAAAFNDRQSHGMTNEDKAFSWINAQMREHYDALSSELAQDDSRMLQISLDNQTYPAEDRWNITAEGGTWKVDFNPKDGPSTAPQDQNAVDA